MLSEVKLLQEYSYLRSKKNHEFSIAYLDPESSDFAKEVSKRRIVDIQIRMDEVKRLITILRQNKWFPDKCIEEVKNETI